MRLLMKISLICSSVLLMTFTVRLYGASASIGPRVGIIGTSSKLRITSAEIFPGAIVANYSIGNPNDVLIRVRFPGLRYYYCINNIAYESEGTTETYYSSPFAAQDWNASLNDVNNTVTVTKPNSDDPNLPVTYNFSQFDPQNPNKPCRLDTVYKGTSLLLEYIYNETTGLLESIYDRRNAVIHAEYTYTDSKMTGLTLFDNRFTGTNNPNSARSYTYEYDENGHLSYVDNGGASCESCSSNNSSNFKQFFDENDNLIQEKNYNDDDVYDYTYVTIGSEYFGDGYYALSQKENVQNVILQTNTYTIVDDLLQIDTKDYVGDTYYRYSTIKKDKTGRIHERTTYAGLTGLGSGAPTGDSFTERYKYRFNSDGKVTQKIYYKASVPNDWGPRTEYLYTYDESNGNLLREEMNRYGLRNAKLSISKDQYYISGDVSGLLQYSYDVYGLVSNHETVYSYNDEGQTTSITYPSGKEVHYSYNSLGKRICEKEYAGSTLKHAVNYAYDDYGNIVKSWVCNDDCNVDDCNMSDRTASGSQVTEYFYNGFGEKLWEVSPAGVVSGYIYDEHGKLVSSFILGAGSYADAVSAYNAINKYTFDGTGVSLISQTKYTYDVATGKIKSIEVAKSDSPFTYDASGLTWIKTEYEYDLYGRKIAEIKDTTGLALKTTYEYNYQNELIHTFYPDGKWKSTHRDGRGLISFETVGHGDINNPPSGCQATEYTYDADGNIIEIEHPDGSKTLRVYDAFGRVIHENKVGAAS